MGQVPGQVVRELVDLRSELGRVAAAVNEYIESFLRGEPSLLYEAAYHLIRGGGKRLRPFVVVEFYRMFGGDERDVIPAAAAVELIHNFTLVHDDIMDRDDFRRGVPTVHRVYGEPMAILAGDALFAKSYMALLESSALRRDGEGFRRAVESVTRATVVLCEGQTLDYQLSKSGSFSADDYYRLVRAKTSALFIASAELGVIASSRYEYLDDARGFADNLGIAFQLIDDLLGLIGDPSVTGKPVGSDVREGKKTLPIALALERLPGEESGLLRRLWGSGSADEESVARLVAAIRESGIEEEVRGIAESHIRRSLEHLSRFPEGEPRDLLRSLAEFVVARNY
ncbi:MAG: polyprenyl synthetase family protein [Conexivisphaera sp.]